MESINKEISNCILDTIRGDFLRENWPLIISIHRSKINVNIRADIDNNIARPISRTIRINIKH